MLKMFSATATLLATPASSDNSSLFAKLPKVETFSPKHIESRLCNKNESRIVLLQCVCSSRRRHIDSIPKLNVQNPSFSASCLTATSIEVVVADKLRRLVAEFKSLSEPIDRVKRLLHYAALLPPLEESARVPENRVMGCATQVWMVAEMDKGGRMRFKADSDSEISKGFCSCLIWMLDGAEPEEVLMVEREHLVDMNVGLHGKAQSRVNTWHNVLFSMQKATKALVVEMEGKPPLEPFPSLIVTADDIPSKGNFSGVEVKGLPYIHMLSTDNEDSAVKKQMQDANPSWS